MIVAISRSAPTSQSLGPSRETPANVISRAKPLTTSVPTEETILFDQIRERLTLTTIEPADQDGEHRQAQRVDHGGQVITPAGIWRLAPVGRHVGHYELHRHIGARCHSRLVVLAALVVWTALKRWGAGLALHYLSRVYLARSRGSSPAAAGPRE